VPSTIESTKIKTCKENTETEEIVRDNSEQSSQRKRKRNRKEVSSLLLLREQSLVNADKEVKVVKKKRRVVKVKRDEGSKDIKSDVTVLSNESTTESTATEQTNSVNAKKRVEGKVKSVKSYIRPENAEKDARTVFVGNVSLSVDKKALLKLFSSCGKVESIRIRSVPVSSLKLPKRAIAIMKDFHPHRHNMNAYVMFKDEQSADDALKLNGTELGGLHIRVDKSQSDKQHDHKR